MKNKLTPEKEGFVRTKESTKMITASETYTYMGWSYHPWIYLDEFPCRKLWHDFVHENGTTVSCDFSPYEKMTTEDIRFWIDLLMPDRIGCGPLDSHDLNAQWREENTK
jgi:hypothetical protein